MIIDKMQESGMEILFSCSLSWEMFFSMHVLANPEHHLGRRKWVESQEERYPELVHEIQRFREDTKDWTIFIDVPAWNRLRQMETGELLAYLKNRNIYEWTEMFGLPDEGRVYPGKPDLQRYTAQRDAILRVLADYYQTVFCREEVILKPYLMRAVREELKKCGQEGIWRWCGGVHPRLLADEDGLTFLKNREYSFPKKNIAKIYVSVSTFVEPHLWLYEAEGTLEIVKGIGTEQAEKMIPKDFVRIFKALGDETRLEMIRLLLRGVRTTQTLAAAMGVSEAGVSRNLKLLREAGLVKRERNGAYVEYDFCADVIDFIPYTFYETIR